MKQPLLKIRNESGTGVAAGRSLCHLVKLPNFKMGGLLAGSLKQQRELLQEARDALKAGQPSKAQALVIRWKHERTLWRTLLWIRSMRALQNACPAMDYRPATLRQAGLDWYGEVSEQGWLL